MNWFWLAELYAGPRRPAAWRWLVLPAVSMVASWAFFLSDRAPNTNAAMIGFPLDDAWTHQVYARSLAQEYGFYHNTGVAEGGMTSPLWVGLLAPLHIVSAGHTVGVVLGTKLLGLLFGLSGMVLLYALSRELELGELTGILAALLFAIDPSRASWAGRPFRLERAEHRRDERHAGSMDRRQASAERGCRRERCRGATLRRTPDDDRLFGSQRSSTKCP